MNRKKKIYKNEKNLRDLTYINRYSNVHIMGDTEKRREKGWVFKEIMAKSFPKLKQNVKIYTWEAQQSLEK